MKSLMAVAPFAVALPLLVYSAIWQGQRTERWGEFPELKEFANRLDALPTEVGHWQGKVGPRMDEETRRYAGAEGDKQITFVKSGTGERVNVFLVCGRLMDMMNHRPDRCYPAHGYKTGEDPRHFSTTVADGSTLDFQTAIYTNDEHPAGTRIYWTWSTDGAWIAPDDADLRQQFDRTRPVFKLYFDYDVQQPNQPVDQGACIDLIKVLMPEINRVLFPKAVQAVSASG